MLDETVGCIYIHLEDDHRLTVTNMQREMAAHFTHKAVEATTVCALQQLKMGKVYAHWLLRQLMEKHRKNCMGTELNFISQYKEDGKDLLERIITS